MTFLLDGEETERLLFRPLFASDFEAWLPFHEKPLSTQYWKTTFTNPRIAYQEKFKSIFERYAKNLGGMNALICRKTNKFIGMCGLLVQEVDGSKELEIGYSILPKYWGKGYASQAAVKCKEVAFNKRWATHLIAIIQVDNIPSQKVATKVGMALHKTTTYKTNEVHIYSIDH